MHIFGVGLHVRQISITHGSNPFILSVEVYWEGLLCTLDFGDLGIIFKVTQIENVYFWCWTLCMPNIHNPWVKCIFIWCGGVLGESSVHTRFW